MGRALTCNVVVVDESGTPVVLENGSEVPEWAADQVGDHCFDKSEDDESKPVRKSRQSASK
jgi:hypothetical protein